MSLAASFELFFPSDFLLPRLLGVVFLFSEYVCDLT